MAQRPFNDMPNVLTSKTYFSSLKIAKSDNAEWVQVNYESDSESIDDNIGKLVLTYWVKPEFCPDEVFLFKGPSDENN